MYRHPCCTLTHCDSSLLCKFLNRYHNGSVVGRALSLVTKVDKKCFDHSGDR